MIAEQRGRLWLSLSSANSSSSASLGNVNPHLNSFNSLNKKYWVLGLNWGNLWFFFFFFLQDYRDAKLCIHWDKLQFSHSWICYEQFDPCFHFLACCYLQVYFSFPFLLTFMAWLHVWLIFQKQFLQNSYQKLCLDIDSFETC